MNKTGYFSHRDCRRHDMGEGHPECPARLDAIEDRLLLTGVADALERCEAPVASPEALALAHDPAYLGRLRRLDEELRMEAQFDASPHRHLDPDTVMMTATWEAALRASGAAIAATDAVATGRLQNAFCAVRPPGHHACRDEAMGFCFLNNVAIAARHALAHHGLDRVAVVDFDVHHGNGTEDIVAGDDRILMVSFYQHPYYPAGGSRSRAPNLLNLPVPAYTRGAEIRPMIEEHWLPRLEAFRPQMLFISAGFDAHREDDMGQLGLVEADYAWITQRLKEVAQRHANGRIVSCLEGGYHLDALARSVEAHLRVLADL